MVNLVFKVLIWQHFATKKLLQIWCAANLSVPLRFIFAVYFQDNMKKQFSVDRQHAPALRPITHLNIVAPQHTQLDNGIPAIVVHRPELDIVMVKLLFPAGNWYEPQKQVASLTNRMLTEGTQHLSSADIAHRIEYYGAYFQTAAKNNHGETTLYTLGKHTEPLLSLAKTVLTEATFPATELQKLLQLSEQRLLINRQKNEFIADELLNEKLWGSEHPYGYKTELEDLKSIEIEQLQQFYTQHYNANNAVVYIAGNISDSHWNLINQYFGQTDWANKQRIVNPEHASTPFVPQKIHIPRNDSVQVSIRIARPLFNKTHHDYQAMFVVNTILGGFYGSRLMNNLREDNSYTYGIYSYLQSYLYGGTFGISTEVGKDVYKDALQQIYAEMELLQTELVDDDELNLVRNYLMGTLLSQMSGTFKLVGSLQGLYVYGLTTDYYEQFVHTIQNISAEQIRSLAQKYLQPKDMVEILAGV